MARPVSSGLKTTFLLFALFGGALGAIYFLVPVAFGDLVGWTPAEPLDHRVIGSTFLAFALASWLASRESEWSSVRIVTIMNGFWTSLATLLMAWSLLTTEIPTLGWVYVVSVGAFAIAFIVACTRHSKS